MKSKRRRITTFLLCLAILAGIISIPGTVLAAAPDHTGIDYSAVITVGTPVTSQISDTESLSYAYIRDDLYFDKGYTVSMQKDRLYAIKVQLTDINFGEDYSYAYNEFYLLTGGSFSGDVLEDVLYYRYFWYERESDSRTFVYYYKAQEDGDVRVLTGLYENILTSVNYSILVEETEVMSPEWTMEGDDYIVAMAVGPDGTVYYSTIAWVSEYNLTGITEEESFFGELVAVAADGTEKWRKPLPGEANDASLLVGDDGTMYLTCDIEETDEDPPRSRLLAFDSAGNELWHLEMEEDEEPVYLYGQMALSADGVLIVIGHYDSFETYNDGEQSYEYDVNYGVVVAVNAATGETLWMLDESENGNDISFYELWCSPAIFEDVVYLGGWNSDSGAGTLFIVDISTGEIIETLDIDDSYGPTLSSFAVGPDGTVYFVNSGNAEYEDEQYENAVWAVTPDGSVRWVADPGFYSTEDFIVTTDGEKVYVGADGLILILDAGSGEELDRIDVENDIVNILLTGDGGIWFQSSSGILSKYDPAHEEVSARILGNDYFFSTLIFCILTDDGKIYVRDEQGISQYDSGSVPVKNGWAMVGGNAGKVNRFIPYIEYTVSFNTNGDSAVAPITLESGTSAAKPADPQRSGYKFLGWYTDSAFTTPFDFSAPVTANITLYAKWEKIQADPPASSTTSSDSTPPTSSEDPVPPTGDGTNPLILVILLLSSVLCAGWVVSYRKKRSAK